HLQGIRGAPALGDGTPDLPDPGPPRSASAAEEVASALARRPELARFGVLKRQVSIEMDLARNQTRPAIDLQAAVSKDVGPGPDNLRPIDVELGLVIDLPVLARVGRGKLEAATAKLDKLDLQQTLFKNRLTADVNDALVAEAAARERIQLARTELAVARRLAQAERDALDLGSSTLLVVNLREQAVADAAFKEVSALADYHRAVAVLQAVTASQPGVVASAARVD
ncbi:MAG: TolC family protein, partial [Myxococcales bacterium]|nr:TolC family protein [Myxococcales bacterium]